MSIPEGVLTKKEYTHIVGTSVSKDIIKCIRLRDILGSFADDNNELHFVIREMVLRWLGHLWDYHGRQRANKRCDRFIEEDGESTRQVGASNSVEDTNALKDAYAGLGMLASA